MEKLVTLGYQVTKVQRFVLSQILYIIIIYILAVTWWNSSVRNRTSYGLLFQISGDSIALEKQKKLF